MLLYPNHREPCQITSHLSGIESSNALFVRENSPGVDFSIETMGVPHLYQWNLHDAILSGFRTFLFGGDRGPVSEGGLNSTIYIIMLVAMVIC